MRLGRGFNGSARIEVSAAHMGFPDPVGERDEIDILGTECRQAVGGAVGKVDDVRVVLRSGALAWSRGRSKAGRYLWGSTPTL
jgi:hypothetical protein